MTLLHVVRVSWSLSNVISVRSLPLLQLICVRFLVLRVLARSFEPNLLGIRTQILTFEQHSPQDRNKVRSFRVT